MAGLNDTQNAERIHISFFGNRNAGKSSLVNAITNQQLSIVSDVKGTTTDPVMKAMEILPLGPVMIIDTPGLDDEGELGSLRVKKAISILNKTDIAILVIDVLDKNKNDENINILINEFNNRNIKYIVVYNKCDLLSKEQLVGLKNDNELYVSATKNINIEKLKTMISNINVSNENQLSLVGDFVKKEDIVILVMPQDGSAPKGRIILPQVQMIRDLLDNNVITICVQPNELDAILKTLNKKPALVITDSQVFKEINDLVPEDIKLTSFSILLARYKGLLDSAVNGVSFINKLTKDDKVLIAEACTHHRQCEDIGTVKIPNLLEKKLGFKLNFDTCSGHDLKEDLTEYKMIIHCGGCMINEREMKYRIKTANDKNIPITNYGILIAYLQGILKRCLSIMPDLQSKII